MVENESKLRKAVLRLARENPSLRPHLLPLVRKTAGYGVYPKVYGWHDDHETIWVWTSAAGFGRKHHIESNLKMMEKALGSVVSAQWFTGHIGDRSDTYFEPRKSQPREMIGYFSVRFKPGAAPLKDLVFVKPRTLGLDGWKPIPK